MELTRQRYEKIKDSLPLQRGNVRLSNLEVLNAILYVAEQGLQMARPARPVRQLAHHVCADEPLGQERRARPGVREAALEQMVRIKVETFSLDSTSVKVHPDGTGASKKTDRRRSASPGVDGTPRFIWLARILERP
jgi:hypothetical protein